MPNPENGDYRRYQKKAELRLGQAYEFSYGDGGDPAVGQALATEGQAWATLALAAALRNSTPED